MRSFSIVPVLLVLVSSAVFTTAASADDNITSVESLSKRKETLKQARTEIQQKIKASSSSDEIAALRARLDLIDENIRTVEADLRTGARLTNAVLRKERKIGKRNESNDELMEKMKKAQADGDVEAAAQIRDSINANNEVIKRKKKSIDNKETKFEKKFGEEMPSRKPIVVPSPVVGPITEASAVPPSSPQPPSNPLMSEAQKRELAECWDLNKSVSHDLYVFFPIGGASIKSDAIDDEYTAYLDAQVKGLAQRLDDPYHTKISKLLVTSYTSTVPFLKTAKGGKPAQTPEDLSKERSKSANAAIFTLLGVQGKTNAKLFTGDVTREFDEKQTTPEALSIGPKYIPGDYTALSKKPMTPESVRVAAIRKAAISLLANQDPTPVRVTGKDEEESITLTMEKLEKCCATNPATLKYQPFQYSKITATLPNYNPNAPACMSARVNVTTTTAAKPVDPVSAEAATSGSVDERSGHGVGLPAPPKRSGGAR